MKPTTHNSKIKLKKEHKHKEWLKQNLQNSKQLKQTKKSILKLYTAIAENEKAKQANEDIETIAKTILKQG